jgi:hypothetical protein
MTVFLQMYSLMGMNVLGLRRTAVPGQPPPPFVNTLYPLSVKRNATFAPFLNQMHHLPRQARDKHRESSNQSGVSSGPSRRARSVVLCYAIPSLI